MLDFYIDCMITIILYICTIFFCMIFLGEETPLPEKLTLWARVHEQNPHCLRLLQMIHVLLQTQDLLCRSQIIYYYATPLQDFFFI